MNESVRREVARIESLGGTVTIEGLTAKVVVPGNLRKTFEDRLNNLLSYTSLLLREEYNVRWADGNGLLDTFNTEAAAVDQARGIVDDNDEMVIVTKVTEVIIRKLQ